MTTCLIADCNRLMCCVAKLRSSQPGSLNMTVRKFTSWICNVIIGIITLQFTQCNYANMDKNSEDCLKKEGEKSSEGQRSPNQQHQGVPKEVSTEYTRAILGKGKRYRDGDGGQYSKI